MADATMLMRFRISLLRVEPTIWRVIDVPADYSFWDLHVAIQDAMGWHDEHLHVFALGEDGKRARERLGLSMPDAGDGIRPDHEVKVADRLSDPGDTVIYIYDFGDYWRHAVELIDTHAVGSTLDLPRCVDGERACPPEDCGGDPGYEELLEVLADPRHEAHADMVAWLKRHPGGHWPFDPEAFEPGGVVFRDPAAHLASVLQDLNR